MIYVRFLCSTDKSETSRMYIFQGEPRHGVLSNEKGNGPYTLRRQRWRAGDVERAERFETSKRMLSLESHKCQQIGELSFGCLSSRHSSRLREMRNLSISSPRTSVSRNMCLTTTLITSARSSRFRFPFGINNESSISLSIEQTADYRVGLRASYSIYMLETFLKTC